jgi:hypothetical protein
MAVCGYTPAEIDEMPFCDVVGLYSYWRDYPPVDEIMKCVYRIERVSDGSEAVRVEDPSNIGSLISRFPGGFVRDG